MKKKFIVLLALIAVPLLIGYWTGYSVGRSPRFEQQAEVQPVDLFQEASFTPTAQRDSINADITAGRRNAITRAVALASPAVVGINVTEVREYRYQDPFAQLFGNDPFFRQYFGGQTYKQEVKGLGSGFIISSDGCCTKRSILPLANHAASQKRRRPVTRQAAA